MKRETTTKHPYDYCETVVQNMWTGVKLLSSRLSDHPNSSLQCSSGTPTSNS